MPWWTRLIVAAVLAACPGSGIGGIYNLNERFGVVYDTAALGRTIAQYDHALLGDLGWYIDGQADHPSCPGPIIGPDGRRIERIPVVGGKGADYLPGHDAAGTIVAAHPDWYPQGSVWMIGGEIGNDCYTQTPYQVVPSAFKTSQYAEAFHRWHGQIKELDDSYRVMLGAVVPGSDTALSWDTRSFLVQLFRRYHIMFGEPMPVDVFNLRLYFNAQAMNLDALISSVKDFRSWMTKVEVAPGVYADYSDSELWLTGYGLADAHVSDEAACDMMRQWTDWLCGYSRDDIFDVETGLAVDDDRLVQRWGWFALDDTQPAFTATRLFESDGTITALGLQYSQYLLPEPCSGILLLTAAITWAGLRTRHSPQRRGPGQALSHS